MGIRLINKMKYFAIAALLGLVSSAQVDATHESIGHKTRLAILNNLIQIEEGSDSESEEETNVQVRGCDDCYGEVPAFMDKSHAAGGYNRVVPDRFVEERDDQLMESVIEKYAREIKIDGKLTGTMMLNLEDAFNHFDVNHDGLIEAERCPQFLRYLFPQGA